jgi:hypothetical protein
MGAPRLSSLSIIREPSFDAADGADFAPMIRSTLEHAFSIDAESNRSGAIKTSNDPTDNAK